MSPVGDGSGFMPAEPARHEAPMIKMPRSAQILAVSRQPQHPYRIKAQKKHERFFLAEKNDLWYSIYVMITNV